MDIVIPTYILDEGKLELLRNSCYSLKGHNLIIVDNGSPMGGGEARELANIYVKEKVNVGFAKAVNHGMKLAGSIVCISNDDIRVPEYWEDVAMDILKDKTVGSVHFRMIPYTQPFNPGNETWTTGKERWCSSSFFVVRNELLFDENYKSGVEDWDFWKRFREMGYKTAYTNKAEYQHADSSTLQRLPSRNENQKFNIEYFVKKWGKTPEEDFEELHPGQLSQPWKPMP